ncbi:MAG: hypothetical protein JWP97_1863 [Labilithrix sp.]|nr:hypothetical protein [Labilithrix sp.]
MQPDATSLRILRRRNRQRAARGFTLVELAVVVAIVGVLAVIAVVGYRKFTLTAKVSEAQNMISAIRIAQEDYKVERGTYADLSTLSWCPSDGMAQAKTDWYTPACAGWRALPVHVDGPVQFGYKTIASPSALPSIGWVDMSAAAAIATTRPWYVIQAQADLDGQGTPYTELVGTSFQNTIFSHQEGQ